MNPKWKVAAVSIAGATRDLGIGLGAMRGRSLLADARTPK